ncbi:MFS transporter [Leuconostoc gasicomitatum]|uniref:MFS transporter n=1 Tax=Leuconostoc gasicomitatum TaxID=115778 RepID=A0A9Q3SW79_9LACO|nr:MFS transporter [Leuconostoc gasicomitatum]MBZ5962900.1 MFS transporter [Leuconostoc gasicomitatum]
MKNIQGYVDDPLVQKRRWLILISVCLMTFMATLDSSIVNIALPVISQQLNIRMNQTEWIISIYLVIICVCLLPLGKIGDAHGKVKLFKISIFMFMIGSIICALSGNLLFLLIGRVIQAIAAGMNLSTNNGIVTEVFPEKDLGKGLAALSTVAAVGSIAGPSLGGLLLSYFHWSYIFWINIPIGIFSIVVGMIVLPKDISKTFENIDWVGASSFALGLICTFLAVSFGQESTFKSGPVIVLMSVGIAFLIFFVWFETHTKNPMLRLSLLKNPIFGIGFMVCLMVYFMNFAFNVVSPFYLENVLKLSPNKAGLIWMLFPIVQIIVAPVSGILSDRVNQLKLAAIGIFFTFLSQFGLSFVSDLSPLILFAICVAIMGLGNGVFNTPNNAIAMNSVKTTELGLAGSLMALAQNLGMVIGNLGTTTLLFSAMSYKTGQHVTNYIKSQPNVFIYGMHIVFLFTVTLSIVSLFLLVYRVKLQKKVPSLL